MQSEVANLQRLNTYSKKWQPATNLGYDLLVKAETKHN